MMDEVKKWQENQTRFSYKTATDIRNFINIVVKQRFVWKKIGIREQKLIMYGLNYP